MKKIFIAISCLMVGSGLRAFGDDAPKPGPNILIEMQVVALPRETAVPLVHDLMDKEKIGVAYARVKDLLANGKAKLIGWPMVTTQSGQRAVVEAIEEFRYATEFTAGGVGVYVDENAWPREGKLKVAPLDVNVTEFNSVPTAFEVRNTGVTLEVEPTLAPDGKTIQINITPQHVRVGQMKKVSIERESTHEKVTTEQPDFDTMKTTTSFTILSGSRILLGVFPTKEPADHLELFILEAEVRPVE